MFKTVIGLEIHVQLKTKSKMFCRCDNKAEEAAPNTLVCPICMGMPGTLPVANKQAIEWTLKTGLALNSEVADFAKFDRKHYFYPDLPKGYQISQYDAPFCKNGFLEVEINGETRRIKIKRVHLEEDAGKLIHPAGKDYSLVDLNRAGTPLMEIVTEPDINSPAEAKIFMQELRSILRYLDVSDADMEKGHLRCDANISVAEIQNANLKNQNDNAKFKMGIPVEIKNMNSFRMVERALLFEEKRQREILENPLDSARGEGNKIIKETRGWNDVKGETYSQRSKEFAQDYRYFPEPDLPPFTSKAFNIEDLKKELPELPNEIRRRIISDIKNEKVYSPSVHDAWVETLIKVSFLLELYKFFTEKGLDKLMTLGFVTHYLQADLVKGIKLEQFHKEELYSIIKAYQEERINPTKTKEIVQLSYKSPDSVEALITQSEMNISDNDLIKIIDDVIANNEKVVSDYRNGKTEALGFLVGQVMKKTQGQANPQVVNKILVQKFTK